MKLPTVNCPFCHKPATILQVIQGEEPQKVDDITLFGGNLKFYCCCNTLNCVHKKFTFVPSKEEQEKILNDEEVVV